MECLCGLTLRQSIRIDICSVRNRSPLLQQAAHITKGIYMAPDKLNGLLQYLLVPSGMFGTTILILV